MAKSNRPAKGRSQPWLVYGGIVAIALLVTAVLVYSNFPGGFSSDAQIGPDASVQRGLTGNGYHYLGDEDAPVTLVLYEDFACPNCKIFFTVTEETLIEQYVATGKVLLESRPIAIVNAGSLPAGEAVLCAADQGYFWEYRELIFLNQGNLPYNRNSFKLIADRIGMDTTSFLKCYDDHVFRDELQQDSIAAQQFGIEGTPTLIIAGERFPKAGETSLPDVFAVLDQKYSEATE